MTGNVGASKILNRFFWGMCIYIYIYIYIYIFRIRTRNHQNSLGQLGLALSEPWWRPSSRAFGWRLNHGPSRDEQVDVFDKLGLGGVWCC